jgi:hypothetical protein
MAAVEYYKSVYGRYAQYQVTSYYMLSGNSAVKLDTFHKKMSAIKRSTFFIQTKPYKHYHTTQRITAHQFRKVLKNFDIHI